MTTNKDGGTPATLGSSDPHYIEDDPKRTSSVSERAIGFMRAQVEARRPFFVQVSYYAPHLSVVCTRPTLRKYRRKGEPDRAYTRAWAAMLDELDQGIGRLLDVLDELNVAGSTYVVFTSDNGGRASLLGQEPGAMRVLPNHPLRGAKHELYEGGIRVPFVVRGPGVEAGSVCRVPVVGYDLLPTFHELAGGNGEQLGNEIDGVSLVPLLRRSGKETFRRPQGAIFFHRPTRTTAGQVPVAQSCAIDDSGKLMLTWNLDGTIRSRSLHAVTANPEETDELDLAAARQEQADGLEEHLLAHLRAVDARLPGPAAARERRRAEREDPTEESCD